MLRSIDNHPCHNFELTHFICLQDLYELSVEVPPPPPHTHTHRHTYKGYLRKTEGFDTFVTVCLGKANNFTNTYEPFSTWYWYIQVPVIIE